MGLIISLLKQYVYIRQYLQLTTQFDHSQFLDCLLNSAFIIRCHYFVLNERGSFYGYYIYFRRLIQLV